MKRKIFFVIYIIFLITLFILVYPIAQSYVRTYNIGNEFYEEGEYEDAIEEYKKSLKGFIPKYKECNIRINYALAICNTVELDEKNQESIRNAIEKYENAIEILTEKECNSHNEEAEILKEDIEDEIDRLKKLLKKEDTDKKDDKNEEEEKNENQENKSETIEKKIQEVKESAIKDQRDTEAQFKNYEYDYDKVEKNW